MDDAKPTRSTRAIGDAALGDVRADEVAVLEDLVVVEFARILI
jgi:hypothetical protein